MTPEGRIYWDQTNGYTRLDGSVRKDMNWQAQQANVASCRQHTGEPTTIIINANR